MTAPTVTTPPELSREDLVTAVARLAERLADLAAERDAARADLAEALKSACALQQELDRARHDALTRERLAHALRADLDTAATNNWQLTQRCHDLAVTNGALEQQIDRMQNQPETQPDDHTRRWPFKHAGNAL